MKEWIRKVMRMLGIRTSAQKAREREIRYRMKMKKLQNHARQLERKAETGRLEAYRLGKNGEHEKAGQAASQAMNSGNIARTVSTEIQKCENAHDKAESTRLIRESYLLMNEAGEMVTDMADVRGFEIAKAKNEEMRLRMEQTNEQLDLIQEGMDLDAAGETRNEAGEAALAEIMAQFGESPVTAPVPAETAVPLSDEDRRAWVQSRKEAIRDMVAEA